eukprot:12108972-Alexandrium_andersonii.AAC.1
MGGASCGRLPVRAFNPVHCEASACESRPSVDRCSGTRPARSESCSFAGVRATQKVRALPTGL